MQERNEEEKYTIIRDFSKDNEGVEELHNTIEEMKATQVYFEINIQLNKKEYEEEAERIHVIVEKRRKHCNEMVDTQNVEATKTNAVITLHNKSQENAQSLEKELQQMNKKMAAQKKILVYLAYTKTQDAMQIVI